jgi:hypothetical protein
MVFNKKVYDLLKWLAQIGLPAAGALYFGLAQIWGLPEAEKVVGTITVVDAFLGVILGISTASYNKSDAKYDGSIDVQEDPVSGKKTFSLNLHGDPEDLEEMDQVVFRMNR